MSTRSNWIFSIILLYLLECFYIFGTLAHSQQTELKTELINGTNNFLITGLKGKIKSFGGDNSNTYCGRYAKCEKIKFNDCFDAKIPYNYTSLALTEIVSQEEAYEWIQKYHILRKVPKCWAVIQPFLCAVYFPKCEKIDNKDVVYLPSLEICRKTLEPCRIVYHSLPKFLQCNEISFPPKCNNDILEMKFNTTGNCPELLVPTDSSSSHFKGIEGCGVQCKDPLYTDDEHRQIHKLIAWGGTVCLCCNMFVIATFFIDWQNANKYPALIVFYINLCFLMSCLGWLAQFTSGSRDDIVCRKDGTLRHSEPSAGENLSCIVVFILVYYFLIAAMVWFVILTYAWHLRATGNVQDRIDKSGSYFHLVAWSLPLVLTITTMALSEVDGNSTVGICFVGYVNYPIRAGLLLGPICGLILVGGYFVVRGMIMLFRLKRFADGLKSTSASNKIHLIIVRMGLCALFILVFIMVTAICQLTEFRNLNLWTESLRQFIICKISPPISSIDEEKYCKLENRPSVAMLQLHLLSLFGSGILMSSWCWTPSSLETWTRYIRKKCGRDVGEEIKMQKHKVIAQTWAKRKEFEDKGRLSITLYNTHTDPVGLNFDVNDLNSTGTNDISSTWANYLPQFVKRRFALTGAATTNSSSQGPRKSSVDSEISFSVRHVSVESRRNSVDSQVSVKIAEVKTKVASRTRSSNHHSAHKTTKARNRRRDFFTTARKFNRRRESSTSVESQVIALKKSSYPGNHEEMGLFSKHRKNMKRRSANAGLGDPEDISKFLTKNGKIIFPFLQNQGMTTSSDETLSRKSLKIQDSRLDVVLKQSEMNDKYNDGNDDETIEMAMFKAGDYTQSDDDRLEKQKNLKHMLEDIQKAPSFDDILKTGSKESSRNSKSSLRSRGSKKQMRQNSRRHRRSITKATKRETEMNINESFSSDSSELDIPLGMESSYSGVSIGKPHSRNSKTSCDVGIQANAHEIASQTLSSAYSDNEELRSILMQYSASKNRRRNDSYTSKGIGGDEDSLPTESHQLLPIKRRETLVAMSESEKLKMLLLPSK